MKFYGSISVLGLAGVALVFSSCTAQLTTGGQGDDRTDGNGVADCSETIFVELEERFARPDVLLVVDQSQSMIDSNNRLPNGVSRWSAMTDGVGNLLESFPDVHFGLSLFPSRNSVCSPGRIDVSPTQNTVNSVLSKIDGASPRGQTPTADTLETALDFYQNQTTLNQDGRYVLLATDGNDSCGGSPALVAEKLLDIGVKTFVIGFSGGAIGFEELRRIALSGGTNDFYGIGSGEQLDDSLAEILGVVSEPSCTLNLNDRPVVEEGLFIKIGNRSIGQGNEGWSYDANNNKIVLSGEACRTLQNSNEVEIRVDLGCGEVSVE